MERVPLHTMQLGTVCEPALPSVSETYVIENSLQHPQRPIQFPRQSGPQSQSQLRFPQLRQSTCTVTSQSTNQVGKYLIHFRHFFDFSRFISLLSFCFVSRDKWREFPYTPYNWEQFVSPHFLQSLTLIILFS